MRYNYNKNKPMSNDNPEANSPRNNQNRFGAGLLNNSPMRSGINPQAIFNQCSTGKNIYKDSTSPVPGEFAKQLNYLAHNQNGVSQVGLAASLGNTTPSKFDLAGGQP